MAAVARGKGGAVSGAGFVLRGGRVLAGGPPRPADVVVRAGRVAAVAPHGSTGAGLPVHDAEDLLVMPGVVDAHVHVNEPGRTEWEGWESAGLAAAAGGTTTVVEMPLNGIPPTTGPEGVRARASALSGKCRVDVALWGGIVSADPAPLRELAALGVAGFKCFLSPSGVPEFPHVGEAELDVVLPVARELGLPVLAHAEWPAALDRARATLPAGADPRAHATWLASRPVEAETDAIGRLVSLARRHGARLHVVHVSSREGAALVARARAEGLPLSGETCPHYLAFEAAEVPDRATHYKCAPPIREAAHREALWSALADGGLSLVASDHSPCPQGMKSLERGDFMAAWGGIASLQLLLAATWTGAAERGHDPERLADWLCAAPAALAGLSGRKGAIVPGADADFVAWDETATFRVDVDRLHHRHPLTPWRGRTLRGVVHETWLRGRLVYHRDRGFPGPPGGALLEVRRPAGPSAAN